MRRFASSSGYDTHFAVNNTPHSIWCVYEVKHSTYFLNVTLFSINAMIFSDFTNF